MAAVTWGRDVRQAPVDALLPPYKEPQVRSRLLATADLPLTELPVHSAWIPVQDGPPTTGLFVGSGRFRAELRHATLVGGWQRTWESTDGAAALHIRLVEARNHRYARQETRSACAPRTSLGIPGADDAGFESRGAAYATACAVDVRGRTAVVTDARVAGKDAPEKTEALLRGVFTRQLTRVPVAPDLPQIKDAFPSTRNALNTAAMSAAVATPATLGLIALARDRSTWRRLWPWARRQRRHDALSVDGLLKLRMAAGNTAVMIRFAVYAWAIRLSEELRLGIWATIAMAVGTVTCVLLIEWLVRRRRPARWRPPAFDGPRRLWAVLGVAVSAALVLLAALFFVAGSVFEALGVNPGGSDYVATQWGILLRALGLVILLLSFVPFVLVRRIAMRHLRRRPREDPRRPVLLLRSFADDRRMLRARRLDRASVLERLCLRRFERFEEVTTSALAQHGPVEALSRVGERLPPALGAVRRSFGMDEWRDGVRRLITQSQLLCVTVGRSQSLLWEIRQIRAAGALGRTIFVLPPVSRAEQRRRLAVLGYALGIEWTVLDHTRPGTDVLAVTVPYESPVVITGRIPNDVAYEAAVEVAALAATGTAQVADPELQKTLDRYLHLAHGGVGSAAAVHPTRPPEVQIHAPGKAPEYRPWYRHIWIVAWVAAGVVAAPIPFLLGHYGEDVTTVSLPAAVTSLAQDQRSPDVYAVVAGRHVMRLDSSLRGQQVATTDDWMDSVVVDGRQAYYVSGATGHVGRVDLGTGHTVWRRSVGPGVRALALAGRDVAVTSPADGSVIALARENGRPAGRAGLEGHPYGITAARGRLYVSLTTGNEVVELEAESLAVRSRTGVPGSPRQLVNQGSRVWVHAPSTHRVHMVDTPRTRAGPQKGASVLLSLQSPLISGNGAYLAVEGQERITVLHPEDALRRLAVPATDATSLLVTRDGMVLVGFESGQLSRYE
ncbi:hypothetical protein [Streptomyces sp. NPDC002889]|uniref:hypothetical protein n=1 Tax=Streptomyces sp. NPDC002889 TaxID=3364669 RepID=UPI0036AF9785